MTDTTISGVRIVPEDKGTGLPVTSDKGDYFSAGDAGGLATRYGEGSYVHDGLTVTYQSADTTADITGGLVFITYSSGVDVQDSSTGDYTKAWDQDISFVIEVPAISGLALDASATNDIWLGLDLTVGDEAFYRHGSGLAAPSGPSLKIATVDTTGGTVTQLNTAPDGAFATATVSGQPSASQDVIRKSDLDSHKSTAGAHHIRYTDAEATDAVTNASDEVNLNVNNSRTETVTGIFHEEPHADPVAHGAIGDGTTDDTAAIQAAIDAVATQKTSKVVFSEGQSGTFAISSPLDLSGLGNVDQPAVIDFAGATLTWTGTGTGPMLDMPDTYSTWIQNVNLEGDGSVYGIHFNEINGGSTHNRVSNFLIQNCATGILHGNDDGTNNPNTSKNLFETFSIRGCGEAIRHESSNSDTLYYLNGNISGEGINKGIVLDTTGSTTFMGVNGYNFDSNAYCEINGAWVGPITFENTLVEPGPATGMSMIELNAKGSGALTFRNGRNNLPINFNGGGTGAADPIQFDSWMFDANVNVNHGNTAILARNCQWKSGALTLSGGNDRFIQEYNCEGAPSSVTESGYRAQFINQDPTLLFPQNLSGVVGDYDGQIGISNGSNTTRRGILCTWDDVNARWVPSDGGATFV